LIKEERTILLVTEAESSADFERLGEPVVVMEKETRPVKDLKEDGVKIEEDVNEGVTEEVGDIVEKKEGECVDEIVFVIVGEGVKVKTSTVFEASIEVDAEPVPLIVKLDKAV